MIKPFIVENVDGDWRVYAITTEGKCLLLKNAGEELLAEVVASRLNESLEEGLQEVNYLLQVSAMA